jgi:Hemerythrin HHE cation binding domain
VPAFIDPPPSGLEESLLTALRTRRAELRDSISTLEHALATPGEQPWWRGRVGTALVELSGDLRAHVDITEGEGGLYGELLEASPRLAGDVDRLVREHGEIGARIEELLASLDGSEVSMEELRLRGTSLLGMLVRHRQRGADLVYNAYEIDLGGET